MRPRGTVNELAVLDLTPRAAPHGTAGAPCARSHHPAGLPDAAGGEAVEQGLGRCRGCGCGGGPC
jgi:hypothetical protein